MPIEEDLLAELKRAIEDRGAFLADPDQHRAKVIALSHSAHAAGQMDDDQLCDALEVIDAARIWAQVETAEAERIGLFVGRTPEEGVTEMCR
ncbi:hypothetical protein YA0010_18340 [Pseudomonas syringae]|uniref:Uncharacterized protein n=1 Tax=Pseudomonas phage Medea1 TaxID=2834256 RepID=A0A8E7FQ80_9CAUD|nr:MULTISPECIES: hypothetical protein [Pseudomonas syringae group]YP_010773014.1 hypothetical protein QIT78_gp84 [Pseudomonas phage Medea1]MBI6849017.1 hypothetical protein [Pseudomonas syringae]QVW29151.1 hypothetical protein Medea1_0084 [Pseudomonas phage Medea1]